MRRWIKILTAALLLSTTAHGNPAQEVIDRIAARVENHIILLSDVRELSRYQLFVDGKSESDAQILERLIDQWIVRNEATASRYPQPSTEDIQHSLDRLKRSFSSPEAFDERSRQSGLTDDKIRSLLASQLFLSNYLDSRFRSSAQVDEQAVEDFYKTRVLPRAESRGQTPPTLDAAREFIQEALVQQAINEQADRWLKESRSRVHAEILLTESTP
jgi:parvulin-like peptidyl-prolyl isomerase